ncbi:HNH endonuclease [Lederbergia citri]|uniref:HNH endonuclease n=1 Tax=Lederbergia citri TaxID=2833580 RepID=A0A942YE39_9BACI|nr:HNH endonuclease [Lederbergia citri]
MTITAKEETRTCRICDEEKRLELFEVDKRYKGGYSNRCKLCKFQSNTKPAKAFRRFYEKQNKYPIPVETDLQEIEVLFDICSDHCAYCSEPFDSTPTIDHITPLSMEGSRHHISNLQLVCDSCNSRKRDKSLFVFFEDTPEFSESNLRSVIKMIAYFSGRHIFDVMDELQAQYKRYYAERRSIS